MRIVIELDRDQGDLETREIADQIERLAGTLDITPDQFALRAIEHFVYYLDASDNA